MYNMSLLLKKIEKEIRKLMALRGLIQFVLNLKKNLFREV